MATRERKATRSNADSPTISANSSARSDTASPVTVTGRSQNNKNKTETTPVRNPLRSTRAGSVAQSQSGSPTEESADAVAGEETSRLRSTRQTGDEKTPSRGIRKVQATVVKRNSLPVAVDRAAKMSTRRNSSGRMEAILRACKEDDSGALVTKSKRGRPLGAQNTTGSQPAVVAGRSLLRRKRVLSASDTQTKVEQGEDQEEEEMAGGEDQQQEEEEAEEGEAKAQKVPKLDEAALSDSELSKGAQRRRSVDSVVSKCSEATDQSMSSEVTTTVKQELGEDEEEEMAEEGAGEEEKSTRGRGRPVGRKRKRGQAGKRSSPVKGGAVAVAVAVVPPKVVAAEEAETEEKEEDSGGDCGGAKSGEQEEEETAPEKEEESEDQQKVEGEDDLNGNNEEQEEKKKNGESDAKSKTEVALSGELTVKVEPTEEQEEKEKVDEAEEKGKEKLKECSPSPVLPSESLSPVSVQQICGQPAFLENNPGIEKDPAVAAEMVVQEKEKIAKKADADQMETVTEEREAVPVDGKENQSANVPAPVDGAAPEQGEAEEMTNGAAEKREKATTPVPVKEIKMEPESPECSTKKENHLKVLGLLTLQAADKAKHEKARRREILKAFPTPPSFNLQATAGGESDGGGSGGAAGGGAGARTGRGNNSGSNSSNPEYTGTLKTVIKLNRKNGNGASSSKAAAAAASSASGGRQSLKITFQKGRGKGGHAQNGAAGSGGGGTGKDSRQSASEGEEYYTISKEVCPDVVGRQSID